MLQMFGSVSSILHVDVDEVIHERDCNSVCTDYCRE